MSKNEAKVQLFNPHAREWSVNNLKQYENTPDTVMYSTWKKKK